MEQHFPACPWLCQNTPGRPCYFLVRLILCFFSCSASCQMEETQGFFDWICTVGMPWFAVMGTVEDPKKSRHKILLLSQKISCGEMALIIPGDILRRLNYGSWNIFLFHSVSYMNKSERCFHTANPMWETERTELNKCGSVRIIDYVTMWQKILINHLLCAKSIIKYNHCMICDNLNFKVN